MQGFQLNVCMGTDLVLQPVVTRPQYAAVSRLQHSGNCMGHHRQQRHMITVHCNQGPLALI